jgi:hypothetical protein
LFVDEKFVGLKTEKKLITLTSDLVTDYIKAIGEEHLFVPPTLPFIFWQYFSTPWLEGKGPLVHGTQSFYYNESLVIGETYECFISFNSATRKKNLQFLNHDLLILKDGVEIGKVSSVFIIIGLKGEKDHV